MPAFGIAFIIEDGSLETTRGRAKLVNNLQQVDSAFRAGLTADQYARLTPADYTWTSQHDVSKKWTYVSVRVNAPEAVMKAKL